SLEYDEAAFGDPGAAFSDRYLRFIRIIVGQRFWKLQQTPEPDYCDADIDDVAQDVVMRMLWFFRERSVREKTEPSEKSRYLCALASRFAQWQVIRFYKYRDFNRNTRAAGDKRPRLWFVEDEKLRLTHAAPVSDRDRWGPFEEKVNERFPPSRAAAVIALASSEGVNEAARNIGVTHSMVAYHRGALQRIFDGKRADDLFGGLEPRVCKRCGSRIQGGMANTRYCSSACYKQGFGANAYAAKKAERAMK
ncbi:MAG: hypothetical protein AAFU85_11320, partial [Planctomycetota bacterium]